MDNPSFDHLRCSIDQLATTKQLLLACMVTPQQASRTVPYLSVSLEGSATSVATVEPLTHTRLDEIRRDVGVFKSTWETIREQYPPGKSDFAPLSFSARSWAVIASTGGIGIDEDLETDEAYSLSATMAAYGVDLLRKALGGPQVDRGLTTQVFNLLATLCAMLTDSQDRHRSKLTRVVGEKVESFKRARTTDESSQTVGTNVDMRAKQPEPIQPGMSPIHANKVSCRASVEYLASPATSTHGQRVSGSDTSQCGHPHFQDYPPSAESWQQQQQSQSQIHTTELSSPNSGQNGHLTTRAPVPTQSPISVDNCLAVAQPSPPLDSQRPGAIVSAPAGRTKDLPAIRPPTVELPVELHRQNIIHKALLRRGWTISAISAYFKRLTDTTNQGYNSKWNGWVKWCLNRGIDPLIRSDANLSILTSDTVVSKKQKTAVCCVVRQVWSIVDGTAELRSNQ